MAQLSNRFPQDLAYEVSLDTTQAVTAGMQEIEYTLLEALGLVVLVVYIFLQGWRATLIPLLAVPVSLDRHVRALSGARIFHQHALALRTVLAIGLVVDDAIVVVEAVERHIEEGMAPRDAAFKAMEEVSGPVVAIALDPGGGLHSHRFHSWHHGTSVSAVCGHHCDLGCHLGVQCAVAEPGSGGVVAEAAQEDAWTAGGVLRLVQPRVRHGDRWLCRLLGGADAEGGLRR